MALSNAVCKASDRGLEDLDDRRRVRQGAMGGGSLRKVRDLELAIAEQELGQRPGRTRPTEYLILVPKDRPLQRYSTRFGGQFAATLYLHTKGAQQQDL